MLNAYEREMLERGLQLVLGKEVYERHLVIQAELVAFAAKVAVSLPSARKHRSGAVNLSADYSAAGLSQRQSFLKRLLPALVMRRAPKPEKNRFGSGDLL